jgi:hypothetical protein
MQTSHISQSLIVSPAGGPPIKPNGPVLKAIMLEWKKLMNVDHTHKEYVAAMAKALKGRNRYVDEAIKDFEKAAGLSK